LLLNILGNRTGDEVWENPLVAGGKQPILNEQ